MSKINRSSPNQYGRTGSETVTPRFRRTSKPEFIEMPGQDTPLFENVTLFVSNRPNDQKVPVLRLRNPKMLDNLMAARELQDELEKTHGFRISVACKQTGDETGEMLPIDIEGADKISAVLEFLKGAKYCYGEGFVRDDGDALKQKLVGETDFLKALKRPKEFIAADKILQIEKQLKAAKSLSTQKTSRNGTSRKPK